MIFHRFLPLCATEKRIPEIGSQKFSKNTAQQSADLLDVNMQIINPLMCELHTKTIEKMATVTENDDKFCAGSILGGAKNGISPGACKGDSGGGLFCLDEDSGRYFVHGVMSHGYGCGIGPGIFTKVGGFGEWVAEVLR